MRTAAVVVCLFAAFAVQSELAPADARQRRLASETRVEQAHGNMPVGLKDDRRRRAGEGRSRGRIRIPVR